MRAPTASSTSPPRPSLGSGASERASCTSRSSGERRDPSALTLGTNFERKQRILACFCSNLLLSTIMAGALLPRTGVVDGVEGDSVEQGVVADRAGVGGPLP